MQLTFFFARGNSMIDHEHEQLINMTEAAKLLPNRPHPSTLWRWRRHGVAGVKLEVVCVGGGRIYTSRAALTRFVEGVTAAKSGDKASPRTSRCRERAQQAARQQLIQAGLIDDPARLQSSLNEHDRHNLEEWQLEA